VRTHAHALRLVLINLIRARGREAAQQAARRLFLALTPISHRAVGARQVVVAGIAQNVFAAIKSPRPYRRGLARAVGSACMGSSGHQCLGYWPFKSALTA